LRRHVISSLDCRCEIHGIDHVLMDHAETDTPTAAAVADALAAAAAPGGGGAFSHVGIIHHEV
jgi:hypothetical protein